MTCQTCPAEAAVRYTGRLYCGRCACILLAPDERHAKPYFAFQVIEIANAMEMRGRGRVAA